ncbi:MAG: NAD(P)H-dependent oxidoreductase [Bacteroidaceae bacterium]|nr:NAD(P)H-dependent oxidoreductase [Bacteroidaceae bacterium]
MKKTMLLCAAVLSMTACDSQKKSETEETAPKKILVLYYSQTGTTKAVAEEFQQKLGADIEAISVENDYTGNFQETIDRCMKERETGELPILNPLKANLDDYDVIFLGYPIWFGTYAPPIKTLLKEINLEGKEIVPFCTFGSGGLYSSIQDLESEQPDAEILPGYGVRTARVEKAPDEIDRFLKENGYIEGEVDPLPEYSEQVAVTEEDVKIFDAACGNYQFPLGTPVTVGLRKTPTGTDYLFTVNAKGPNGSESTSKIYVTVDDEEGAVPEFTQVVR